MNNDNHDLDYEYRERRKKRALERKKKMKRRRMVFYALCIILVLIIIKIISAVSSSRKTETVSVEMNLPLWMTQQVLREQSGHPDNSHADHPSLNDKFFIAYDKATGMKKRLAKNSNHITSANDYAYSTKTIREYIRGEKEYTGKQKLVFLTYSFQVM